LRYNFVVGNSGIGTAHQRRGPRSAAARHLLRPRHSRGDSLCAVCGQRAHPARSRRASRGDRAVLDHRGRPSTTGPILNTVTVDPNKRSSSGRTKTVATQGTQVATGIDLTIVKTDAPPGFDPIATNGTQTYTITVDNIGTQNAANIHVRDVMPAGTIFRSRSATTASRVRTPRGG
jgi:uncharacterized repeat protein (TIGR01451 family)